MRDTAEHEGETLSASGLRMRERAKHERESKAREKAKHEEESY